MPIEAVKIPQNVQIEDRIVGPLSLRQIIIMAIGGGFSYMVYSLVQRTYGHVSIPLTVLLWTPAVIAAAFALVNINDLSLLRICFLLLERLQKPSQRTWAPRQGISITIRTSTPRREEEAKKPGGADQRVTAEQQIAQLSSVVDSVSVAATPAPTGEPPPQVQDERASATARASTSDAQAEPPAVRPQRIQVDHPQSPTMPQLSDLSVFRDIFPPNTTWQ